jgi:murein DD-endopeptidase MepM/ murein hydrolase activator NlpD
MAGKPEHKDHIKDRLNKRYRIIFLNDDTLNEINSFKLKYWHLIAGILCFFFTIVAFTFALIYFTPINNMISKWIGVENNAVFIDLNKKIFELEQLVEGQEVYKVGIENLINGTSPPDVNDNETDQLSGEIEVDRNQPRVNDFFLSAPVKGTVSDTFDISRQHYGIDIIAPKDSPIKSILPGIVIQSNWNPETGNSISVQHPFGLVSVYKHNSSLLKKIGDDVKEGEAIAIIGNTGELSSGPHLHFELWYEGKAVNPQNVLK